MKDLSAVPAALLNPSTFVAFDRARERLTSGQSSQQFARTYWDNPTGFVRDLIMWDDGEQLADYQFEALHDLWESKRYALRGPHGLGKTTIAALAVLWFALTRDGLDWKVITTASAWRQLSKFLWPEIHKWARKLNWVKLGRPVFDDTFELQVLTLKLTTGAAFAVASDKPALIEGAHADHIFYCFDESKTITADTFDAAEGAFSGAGVHGREALALAISTPGDKIGRFFDIHSRRDGFEDWRCRHVTLEEAIAAGRISRDWAVQRKKQWGDSAVYQNRALGEFASSEEDSVIPLQWIEAAVERWKLWNDGRELLYGVDPLTAVGIDVARSGLDRTVLAPRAGNVIVELRSYGRQSTMVTTGYCRGLLKRHGGCGIVDVIGIGAGVYDRLREMGIIVVPFNGATRPKDRHGQHLTDRSGEMEFANLISASWWHVRELLDPDSPDDPILLPPDDKLLRELSVRRWWVTSSGKIALEDKDDLKKPDRLGHSPDYADAVVQAFAFEILEWNTEGWDVWGGNDPEDIVIQKSVEEKVALSGTWFPGD